MMPKNPPDENEGLDAAKKKLSSIIGRPFDVDQVLAHDRARQEREQVTRKKAQEKLEEEYKAARLRRHEQVAQKIESEGRTLEEAKLKFENEARETIQGVAKQEQDIQRREAREQEKRRRVSREEEHKRQPEA